VGTYTDRYVYGVAEAVLVDASGNVNVDGTVTADGLTVDGASSSQQITFSRTVSSTGTGKIGSDVSQAMGLWGTDGTKVATFSQNKDISFYEDTGTTPKFFWDASSTRLILDGAEVSRSNNNYLLDIDNSAQSSNLATSGPFRVKGYYGESLVVTGAGNVGIGTSSPAYELDVNGQINIADGKNIRCEGHILIGKSTDDEIRVGSGNTTDILKLFAGGSERMRIGLDGNVGIGTSSPSQKLDVNGSIYTDSQYLGGFGAKSTTGSLDWNDVTNARSGSGYTLLKGDAANGPGDNAYFHTFSYEYNSKDGSGNMAQLAFGYNTNKQYQRIKFSGTWSSWGTVL